MNTFYEDSDESLKVSSLDLEIRIGLLWLPTIRDDFRYLWE